MTPRSQPRGPQGTADPPGRSRPAPAARASFYLHPGQLIATRAPTAIKTILGSCIAVCLWDEAARIGGMNHFLLPYGSANAELPQRFGNSSIPYLIEALHAQGASRETMRGKVFGGATMITGGRPWATRIGLQNSRVAFELLELAGIPVISSDIGGERGRKIVFHTDTGSVSMWEL